MLPPFIIEELREREKRREQHPRPQPTVEPEPPEPPERSAPANDQPSPRGVVVIRLV